VAYDNRPSSETPLYEHLQRSLRYTLDRLGPHGLPLIGRADWNGLPEPELLLRYARQSFQTTTNKDGKVAESVFIGGMFVLAARELAQISNLKSQISPARARSRGGQIPSPQSQTPRRNPTWTPQAKMEATVRQHGWDGDWFVRAYDDFGRKVGSHECEEGRSSSSRRAFCVLAGIGLEDGLAERALAAVREHLATPHGIVVQQPAYSQYYLHLGEISSYPPGYKENAGVFCTPTRGS